MDSIIVTGRQRAEEHNGSGGGGFKNANRKNAYECPDCGYYIVTIDRDPGVTPFMKRCGNCGGMAQSKMYRVSDWLEPTHEWYRPASLAGVPESAYDHIENGGLLLRPIREDRWLPNDFKPSRAISFPRVYSEKEALLKALKDAEKDAQAEYTKTRQQLRHEGRKSREAPAEITMYGARYRRVDGGA